MQKLVITYDIDGGFECGSYEQIICLEYESPEAFIVEFEDKLKCAYEQYKKWFATPWNKRGNLSYVPYGQHIVMNFVKFPLEHFVTKDAYEMPDIRTLEEWFYSRINDNY
jgi:hypothetical protein